MAQLNVSTADIGTLVFFYCLKNRSMVRPKSEARYKKKKARKKVLITTVFPLDKKKKNRF